VRALGALIDDLFELTRLESGELTWTLERVRVDAPTVAVTELGLDGAARDPQTLDVTELGANERAVRRGRTDPTR